MEANRALGVKKGAWTKEEDNLLRKCIDNFGEGKWHLVPLRTGLNRCRRSCRMRWLNYLKPSLRRGCFDSDEIDLILRLHKLLGNRWSLIAGRLPGRTANDIKNFWNTRFEKRSAAEERKARQKTMITQSNITRPRPWNLSKLQVPRNCPSELIPKISEPNIDEDPKNKKPSSSESSSRELGPNNDKKEDDECIKWWSNLLEMTEKGEETPFLFSDEDHIITTPTLSPGLCDHANDFDNFDGFSASSLDFDVLDWDLLSLHD